MKNYHFILIFFLSSLLSGCNSDKKSTQSTKEDTITNVEDWEKIVIGNWKYEMLNDEVKEKQYFKGEVEYLPNGTFIRNVTITVYIEPYGEAKPLKGFEDIIAGGTAKGKWSIDKVNRRLVEKYETCTITNSHLGSGTNPKYDGCTWFDNEWYLGNFKDDYSKIKLIEFSDKKIEINQKVFSTNADLSYEANKIE